MSSVCRFFLRGTCRFGDRCRFVHPGYDSNEQYNRYETSEKPYLLDAPRKSYAHHSENYYSSNETYSDRPPSRYDNYSAGGRYGETLKVSNFDRNYSNSRNEGYDSPGRNYGNSENEYGQNRFRWLSPDYNRQTHKQETDRNQWTERDHRPTSSTPKGKVSFSFKSAESELKKESYSKSKSNELQQQFEMVAEEAKAWEQGKQWPFSCFFPFADKSGLPDFTDISQEELRFYAYKAKENNTYDSYINTVASVLLEIDRNRTQYKNKSSEKLNIIERIYGGEQIQSGGLAKQIFGNLMGCTQSGLSEPMNSNLLPSLEKSSVSTFKFVLPPEETRKSSTEKESDIYTVIDKLTSKEKEQFESSTFTLGKIPTRPPPYVMCF